MPDDMRMHSTRIRWTPFFGNSCMALHWQCWLLARMAVAHLVVHPPLPHTRPTSMLSKTWPPQHGSLPITHDDVLQAMQILSNSGLRGALEHDAYILDARVCGPWTSDPLLWTDERWRGVPPRQAAPTVQAFPPLRSLPSPPAQEAPQGPLPAPPLEAQSETGAPSEPKQLPPTSQSGDDALPSEASRTALASSPQTPVSPPEESQENRPPPPTEETPQEASPPLPSGSDARAHLELPEANQPSSAPLENTVALETEPKAVAGLPEHSDPLPPAEGPARPKTPPADQQGGLDADLSEEPLALESLD
jgi:hypothetical protein